MNRRNKNLLIILLVLVAANVVFALFERHTRGVSFDERKFVLMDTASVSSVQMGQHVALKEVEGDWLINEKHPVDPSLRRLLFSILQRIRVKKPVDIEAQEGTVVQVSGDDSMSFSVWGNPTKTKTYFSMTGDEKVYEVHIPGYNEYLGGLFELDADQWRDRLVMDESWRTIQYLELDYQQTDEDDFTITFDKDFFLVEGVQSIDSNAVVSYLNQFQLLQANEWVSEGRFARYDSLSRKPPLAVLTVESINRQEPFMLDIYPKLEGDRFYLGMTYSQSMLVIDERRMNQILAKQQDFKLE